MTPPWTSWHSAHFSVKHAFGSCTHGSPRMFSYDKGAKFSVFMYGILWNPSMPTNALSPQHVIAYAFSVTLATVKITKLVRRIELSTSHSITYLIPKWASRWCHSLFHGPLGLWNIATNVQGGTYFLGCVYCWPKWSQCMFISFRQMCDIWCIYTVPALIVVSVRHSGLLWKVTLCTLSWQSNEY